VNILNLIGSKPPLGASEGLRVVGIDLGTTNSTVAEFSWDNTTTVPAIRCLNVDQQTTQGRYTHVLVPSVVAMRGTEIWIGVAGERPPRSRYSVNGR
jgi:molecular chaperone DnaK (HSP70)